MYSAKRRVVPDKFRDDLTILNYELLEDRAQVLLKFAYLTFSLISDTWSTNTC